MQGPFSFLGDFLYFSNRSIHETKSFCGYPPRSSDHASCLSSTVHGVLKFEPQYFDSLKAVPDILSPEASTRLKI